ncbi:MAG TPA: CHASE2 domain-containing protein [Usitatibacter sp.]|nr:CHASE2 domain-containing protein [Usitatibacter sp.]
MGETDDGGRAVLRAVAVAAAALAGFLFSLTPVAAWLDAAILDSSWRVLRNAEPRHAADEVIIVGIDPATVSAIPEPPALWHESLARALTRIAAARPRAIGLDFALPEKSYDSIRPGLDRALFTGLATAIESAPFVTVLAIDARTRGAKRIHVPFLALLGESRLGIGLLSRDADNVTRRFSLAIPTEDGAFPTLEGRLCRALKRDCNDGLVNYAIGAPLTYVPLKTVLQMEDRVALERLFRGRIVLIGETQPYSDRVPVPVNLAGWEPPARDSPAIVVHAQALRTALASAAPAEASRPLMMLVITVAALLVLVRDWRHSLAWAVLATAIMLALEVFALRGALYIPPSAVLFTVWIAVSFRCVSSLRARRQVQRPASNFPHTS